MKKWLCCLIIAFCGMLLFVACGAKTTRFQLESMEDGGPFLPGAVPQSSLEEIRESGFPLEEEPLHVRKAGKSALDSEEYLLIAEEARLEIAGCDTQHCLFQFVDGQFTCIHVQFTESDSSTEVSKKLTELYGEPVVQDTAGGRLEQWSLEGEQPVQMVVLHRGSSPGSFQLAYPWFE